MQTNNETIRVLLIDDDEDAYILTRELLAEVKGENYALDWARSYETGLEAFGRGEHHVCLVDYYLGKQSGVQLIREARNLNATTPMILLTGQGSHEMDIEAMEAGATGYLVRDETPAARLERTIRYAVELNIERSRAKLILGNYAQKHEVVAEIGRLALMGSDLEDLFAKAVFLVGQTLGMEYSEVLELLPERDSLVMRAETGWKREHNAGQLTIGTGRESQAGFALLSNGPVVVEDLRTESRFDDLLLRQEYKIISGISVVIRGRVRPYGVLGVHTVFARRFAPDDVSFLRGVANVLAEAIGRKRIQDELRQSETRFRHVVESNMLGIFFGDLGGEINEANEAFLNITGYTRDDLAKGRIRWKEMTPPKNRALEDKALVEVLTSGVCDPYENELIRKDGSCISILIGRAMFEREKNSGVAFVLDITDRKRAGESLKHSESQFRALFENALDALLITNDQGVYVDANPAACDLLGAPYDQVIGRTVDDFTERGSKAEVAKGESLSKEDGSSELFRLQRPDGKFLDVDVTATTDFAHGRHLTVLRDVTERRKLEEQLRQSQKLESVGMLAGGIAHDFNNLLTVIIGYSELSLKRLDKNDPVVRNVEEIKNAAERAASLTRQLLAFSRKQVLQPKILDLNSIIENIKKMLSRLIGEDMELDTSLGIELGSVKADPGQIEQVILNLVVNARDAMPEGGKITIETANIFLDGAYARHHIAVEPGWYAMLAVSDTGDGIDVETQKHIFEPFFTTKDQGKGTGLGLSTVYGIVKQSGGNLWVYSEVGLGTTFKVYLPVVDKQIPKLDSKTTTPRSLAGTETILLAEDEEMVRSLTRDCLQWRGYTVLEAADAAEALSICQQHKGKIHLLLTDMVMPRMSGKDLAKEFVKLRPDSSVLYMSGYTNRAIVHNGVLDGDVAFIEKPFTPDALLHKVVEVLHQN
jgi:two-component system, cell cycle sensor histidine kinase and response regulator CckA